MGIFMDNSMYRKVKIYWINVQYYDSSGVQAKKYFGSLYEPILFCVKNEKDCCFNAEEILVEAKTGAKRKLIDYRKPIPTQYNNTKVPGNVWEFSRVRYRMGEYENHPSQKPVCLLERIIKASSNRGDTVLDPFSGTFTTSFVCEALGRKSIGIEIDTEYYQIGLRRVLGIEEHKGKYINILGVNQRFMNMIYGKNNYLFFKWLIMVKCEFTSIILQQLVDDTHVDGEEILKCSSLLQYINIKTKSANKGSKSWGSFANLYAIYVILEDYIKVVFEEKRNDAEHQGAIFSDLFNRQRELPFGTKLQNHALNHRLNEEYHKYFPTNKLF
ncbi:hypothetical protein FACS1894172_11750 [Spirochaetia bacterium]|nr:hypothetical protein FACS1894172_11750 [Spirochaetia bacterium]